MIRNSQFAIRNVPKGFTLIELLIVIAIIGILSGVLLSTFGGVTESAKIARCQANLRSLAAAVSSYALEAGHYPHAGSAQYYKSSTGSTDNSAEVEIGVHKGWVSWLDQGMFTGRVTAEKTVTQSSYNGSVDDVRYALSNGAIWAAAGQNQSIYQCPVHANTCQKKGKGQPGWSYAMNPYFGYEREKGKASDTDESFVKTTDKIRADRLLLFAEIQGRAVPNPAKYGASKVPELHVADGPGSTTTDGVLQYKSSAEGKVIGGEGKAESIGFNHVRGNQLVGLVAFADGHTETIALPKSGNFEDLTGWLCEGYDVTYSNGKYERVNDSNAL